MSAGYLTGAHSPHTLGRAASASVAPTGSR